MFKRLDLAVEKVREAAKSGLAEAGMQLLADAIQQEPTVPYKEGTLRGSGSVAVAGGASKVIPNSSASSEIEKKSGASASS